MRRMPILKQLSSFLNQGCPQSIYAELAPLSEGCAPLEGRLHTCYSPVRRSPADRASSITAAPQLACVKPAASVHPEPGSNSSLLFYRLSTSSFSFSLVRSKLPEGNFYGYGLLGYYLQDLSTWNPDNLNNYAHPDLSSYLVLPYLFGCNDHPIHNACHTRYRVRRTYMGSRCLSCGIYVNVLRKKIRVAPAAFATAKVMQ